MKSLQIGIAFLEAKKGRKSSIFTLLLWLIFVMSYAFLFRSRIMNFNEDKQNYLPELVLFMFMYSILVSNLVSELLPHRIFFRNASLKDKVHF